MRQLLASVWRATTILKASWLYSKTYKFCMIALNQLFASILSEYKLQTESDI